jgi:hypothetical protein
MHFDSVALMIVTAFLSPVIVYPPTFAMASMIVTFSWNKVFVPVLAISPINGILKTTARLQKY